MSIRELETNLNNVSALADQPIQGASELKAIFDLAGNQIKTYINTVLIPDMVAEFLSKTGGTILQNLTINGNLVNQAETTLQKLIVNNSASFGGGVAINSTGTNNGLELYGLQPYLDFHFNNSASDFTARIIEDALNHLKIIAGNGIDLSCGKDKLTINGVSIKYSLVHSAYETGNYILLTWLQNKLALSVDNNLQGYFTLSSTSDERLKKDIQEINENVIKAVGEVKLKQFRVTRNNPQNKISFGVIAQELIRAFEKYGLNYEDYELIDTIEYEQGTKYFIVNYEQFQILRMAYLEKKLGG